MDMLVRRSGLDLAGLTHVAAAVRSMGEPQEHSVVHIRSATASWGLCLGRG